VTFECFDEQSGVLERVTFEWVTFGYLDERRVNNAHEVSTAHVPELQNKDGENSARMTLTM